MFHLRILRSFPVFLDESKMKDLFEEMNFPETFEGERDKLILDVFYMTGVKLIELINLNLSDIDFQKINIESHW